MSQLVTQTTTYGLSSDQYSISTLSSVGGVLEIMAGNPHDGSTASTPIVDFKSDQSVKFYGIADLSNGVTLPEKVIGTKHLADGAVTSAKIAKNVNIVGNLTGTASKATADASGNVITDTYAPKANPTFTGTVTVPTPSTSDNSTKVASTAYVKSNLANYLPLSGGAVGGSLTVDGVLKANSKIVGGSNGAHVYAGDNNFHGASLQLYNYDHDSYTGRFYLRASTKTSASSDGTNCDLVGFPNGTLQWSGKNIVRSVNGTAAGADGNVVLASVVPTGTILPFCGTSAPTGFLICNGGEISRTTYSALFQLIGTAYGAGDGSTTFNLPNMHHRFLEGTTTTSEVNTYVEAGLPNIVGSAVTPNSDGVSTYWVNGLTNGAFTNAGAQLKRFLSVIDGDTPSPQTSGIDFSATLSNALFGNSDTVQPESIRILSIIKY